MSYLVPKHRLLPYRRRVLALAFILPGFALFGCQAFDQNQAKIQGALNDAQNIAKGAADVTANIPVYGINISAVASLIAAMAGAILTVDKAIEKSRTPQVAGTLSVPLPTIASK